ncbi:MAG: oligosaccharyltransferase complex subunit epsilon [Caeruleum heppii]|nr:MAG: oligosaccharyltransferase complex subunit epsilon [Caeruleum heppii]
MAPRRSANPSSSTSSSTPSQSQSSITSTPISTPSKTRPSTSTTTTDPSSPTDATQILTNLWKKYQETTTQRVKLLDAFMGFLVLLGAVQFVYCVVGGGYPFNAFLSGFSATVGQFVLTASLRIQTNPENKSEFKKISHERAFADFVFGSLLLHFFCVNFIN